MQFFFFDIEFYLSWMVDLSGIIEFIARIFAPLNSLVRLIMGWLTCKTDAEGNVFCDLFEKLKWFLDLLADFPDFDLDFIRDFFNKLLAFFDINFRIDWRLDWMIQIPDIMEYVSTRTCLSCCRGALRG